MKYSVKVNLNNMLILFKCIFLSLNIKGFILAPKYDEELNDVLKSVTVESIIIGSLAETKGFHEGDEVMLISDKNITELGWTEIQHLMESGN